MMYQKSQEAFPIYRRRETKFQTIKTLQLIKKGVSKWA